MSASTVIALYAAIVATLLAVFQIYSWWHARQPHVRVEVSRGFLAMDDGSMIDAVIINVVNDGDHPVRVTAAGLLMQDGSGNAMQDLSTVPGADLPGPVPARDSGMTYLLAEAVQQRGIDIYRPVTAFARLSTRQTLHSGPTRIAAR